MDNLDRQVLAHELCELADAIVSTGTKLRVMMEMFDGEGMKHAIKGRMFELAKVREELVRLSVEVRP